MRYVGIADCNGLESFIPVDFDKAISKLTNTPKTDPTHILVIRAQANRQRHAIVYRANVKFDDAKKIQKYFNEGKYELALMELKVKADNVELASGLGNVEKSWNLIPNKDLDPFS